MSLQNCEMLRADYAQAFDCYRQCCQHGCLQENRGETKTERERAMRRLCMSLSCGSNQFLVSRVYIFIYFARSPKPKWHRHWIHRPGGRVREGHTRKLLRAACPKECAVHLIVVPAPSCRDETCLLVYRFCIAVRSIDVWPRPIGLGSNGA